MSFFGTSLYFIKFSKDLPKQTLALMWLYLQIIGKSTIKFIKEKNFWTFDRNDFKSAVACLVFDDDEMDETALKMKELIAKHFQSDRELVDWSRAAFVRVTLPIKNFTPMKCKLQHSSQIVKDSCLYISINAHNKNLNNLSGKFNYVSMYKKTPIYGRVDMSGRKIYLINGRKADPSKRFWFLRYTSEDSFFFCQDSQGTFELRLNSFS